eukprot:UN3289
MLAVAIACMLIYMVGMGGLFVRTVIVAPKYFVEEGFRSRWKFLFIKYRADVYWWGIVFLVKNFAVNLALVASYLGVVQLYMSMLVTLIYLTLFVSNSPYRHRVANAAEFTTCVCMMYTAALLTRHASRLDVKDGTIFIATGFSVGVPTAMAFICGTHGICHWQRFPVKPWQQQIAQKDFQDLAENFAQLIKLFAVTWTTPRR